MPPASATLPPGHGRAQLFRFGVPQIFTDEQIEEIPLYAAEYGIRSFKFYMFGMDGIAKSVE